MTLCTPGWLASLPLVLPLLLPRPCPCALTHAQSMLERRFFVLPTPAVSRPPACPCPAPALQDDTADSFAAFADALNLTFDSEADFLRRVGIFEDTLFEISEINAIADTYYVSLLSKLTCQCIKSPCHAGNRASRGLPRRAGPDQWCRGLLHATPCSCRLAQFYARMQSLLQTLPTCHHVCALSGCLPAFCRCMCWLAAFRPGHPPHGLLSCPSGRCGHCRPVRSQRPPGKQADRQIPTAALATLT